MAAAAILKIDLHFRFCDFQTEHVFLSLCTNLHQNRVVIAHFIARYSISKRAVAAILKFGLPFGIMNFEFSMIFLVCVPICIKIGWHLLILLHALQFPIWRRQLS
jgi:hypothetical protein